MRTKFFILLFFALPVQGCATVTPTGLAADSEIVSFLPEQTAAKSLVNTFKDSKPGYVGCTFHETDVAFYKSEGSLFTSRTAKKEPFVRGAYDDLSYSTYKHTGDLYMKLQFKGEDGKAKASCYPYFPKGTDSDKSFVKVMTELEALGAKLNKQ